MTKRYTEDEAAAIGRRVAAARARVGLSQRQATEGLPSVSYAYLSRIEAGVRRPTLEALRLLAPRLGVSAAWLATGRDVVELELDRQLLGEVRRTTRRPELAAAIDAAFVSSPPEVIA